MPDVVRELAILPRRRVFVRRCVRHRLLSCATIDSPFATLTSVPTVPAIVTSITADKPSLTALPAAAAAVAGLAAADATASTAWR